MDSNGNECSETCTSNSSEGTIRPCGISVEEPSVEVVKDENELHKIESVNFYQIPGTTLYVDIKDGIVTAGPLSGNEEDKSKRIHKVLHIETSLDQTIHLKVALFSESCSKYIVVRNGNRVELGDSAMWYAAHRNGDSIMFQTTDQSGSDMFLAFDAESRRIVTQPSEFRFSEFLVPEASGDFADC
ncbi:uncharacterized protein LOC132759760 [Ruditapes philippinarum]|uniref:uncharacterized protein LOC132759760 n=1 Tax=Ruditapes philippinarum TaxID=129788 RepID=UPI00295ADA69|nr:uncharacterized protein LOC132759760 [Ruditapes philippinarum]XP_060607575.1 uncharacterized protein LOC132759760 [Ruditapes philippinarum]